MRKIKVLLVEDEKTQMRLLTAMLSCISAEKFKFEVIAASSVDDAIKIIIELAGELDLIITDFTFPEKSGLWIVGAAEERCPKVPIIGISGLINSFRAEVEEKLAIRCSSVELTEGEYKKSIEFLGKPFTPDSLKECLEKVL